MNAPIIANIENIEMFREIIGDGFVEETLTRQKEIQKNKMDAIRSLDRIKENYNLIPEQMQDIESAFRLQSRNFNKLQSTSSEFAVNMDQLRKSSEKLAESCSMIAKNIRKNLNHSEVG